MDLQKKVALVFRNHSKSLTIWNHPHIYCVCVLMEFTEDIKTNVLTHLLCIT